MQSKESLLAMTIGKDLIEFDTEILVIHFLELYQFLVWIEVH